MRDLITGVSGHEERRARQGPVNVEFLGFHEGRGAGKKTTPAGHDLVNRKEKLQEESVTDSDQAETLETIELSKDPRFSKAVKEGLRDLKAGKVGR